MKISKIHRRFSEELKEPKALTNPKDFLGPNWEDVINFWLYIDGLSYDEKCEMNTRYYALEDDVRGLAFDISQAAAEEVVGDEVRNAAWMSAYEVTFTVFADATVELISHHKLLEQNKTLVALPLCLKS